jgi:hypothetical protein
MANMAQFLSDLNETFFDFFDLAVKKFLWVKFSAEGGDVGPEQVLDFPPLIISLTNSATGRKIIP